MEREQAPMNEDVSNNSPPLFQSENHQHNLPLSHMGQQMEGIPESDQTRVLRNSPMTESSLALLGAGQPYGYDARPGTQQGNSQDADTNAI